MKKVQKQRGVTSSPRLPAPPLGHGARPGALTVLALVTLVGCQATSTSRPDLTPNSAARVDGDGPIITSPTGAWILGETKTLTVIPPSGARMLQIELALDPMFQILLDRKSAGVDSEGSGAPIHVPSDVELHPGETLHVRSCAVFPDGEVGAWSASRFPVILATPRILGEPTTSYPGDKKPTIAWSAVGGASGYAVELYREGAGAEPVFVMEIESNSTTRTEMPAPLYPASYRVRVRASSKDQHSEWSDNRAFTVDRVACRIVSPANGDAIEERQPTIEWLPGSPPAKAFELEVQPVDPAAHAGRTRIYDVEATSLCLPDRLKTDMLYRVRVRPVFAAAEMDGVEAGGDTAPTSWSTPVVFSVITSSEDIVPVELLAVDPSHDATNPTVSPDGTLLAYIERSTTAKTPRGTAGVTLAARDRVAILERVVGSNDTSFRPLGNSNARFPGVDSIRGKLHHPSWGINADREPVLLVASAICASGAPASETRGALFRLERLAARDRNLIPALFEASILHPTVASAPASRVYFEAQDLSCIASPDASVIGEIWSMRTDGDDLRLHGLGHEPVLSPAGNRLALIVPGSVGPEIHIRRIRRRRTGTEDTSEVECTLVTATAPSDRFRGLSWCPNGSFLAFARDTGDGFNVFVANVETGFEEQLTDSFSDDVDPAFVPDPLAKSGIAGVVFASRRSGKTQGIYLARYRP